MKSYIKMIAMCSLLSALFIQTLQAQQVIPNRSALPPQQQNTGDSPTQTIPMHQTTITPLNPNPNPSSSTPVIPKPVPVRSAMTPPQNPLPLTPAYFHPGALIQRGGQWEGGDHLFNLTSNIGLYIEIVKSPSDTTSTLNEIEIQKLIEPIFSKHGIVPKTLGTPDQPPLPFFEIRVLLYPINGGFVACCDGRLFESILLKRINLDPGMNFQAITWEKSNLVVAPTETINTQIEKTVMEIAQAFAERFQGFESKRNSIQ